MNKYSDEEVGSAAILFLSHGTYKAVSQITGITRATLYNWSKGAVWNEILYRARDERTDEHIEKLNVILEEAQEQIFDRVKNGNEDRDGNRVRMNGKDLAVTYAVLFDKNRVLQSLPTNYNDGTGKLELLAKRLEAAIGIKHKEVEVIDVEIISDAPKVLNDKTKEIPGYN